MRRPNFLRPKYSTVLAYFVNEPERYSFVEFEGPAFIGTPLIEDENGNLRPPKWAEESLPCVAVVWKVHILGRALPETKQEKVRRMQRCARVKAYLASKNYEDNDE